MREHIVENEFVQAVRKAGGVAYKLTSQTANGLPDRLVLFPPAKTVFVELKAPGKMLRPLQIKRKRQLNALGFPVLCIDRLSQIKPCIDAILSWTPGEPFPEGIGAKVPDLEIVSSLAGSANDKKAVPGPEGRAEVADEVSFPTIIRAIASITSKPILWLPSCSTWVLARRQSR